MTVLELTGGSLSAGWGRAVVVATCLAACAAMGVRTTAGLSRPGDADLYRDIAQAKTFLQGSAGDPFYRGERFWYSPLVPGLVAGLAAITSTDPTVIYTHGGVWLNLLPVLAFYLLARRLVGDRAGAAALVVYVFLQPALPAFAVASYTPWLWAGAFSQTFFYAAMLALHRTLDGARSGSVLCGFALGAAALAHPAPALFGTAITSGTLALTRRWGALGLVALAAGAAASPLLASSAFAHSGHVLNPAAATWLWPPLSRAGLPSLLRDFLVPSTVLAALGLAVCWRRRHEAGFMILLAWMALSAGALGVGSLGGALPVPSFHFLLYLTSAGALISGVGITWLTRHAVLVLIALVALSWSQFVEHPDFMRERRRALARSDRSDEIATTAWLEANTAPGGVVVAADHEALFVVGAAGRKTVAVAPEFSNPFVDHERRARHRDRMMRAAALGDEETFRRVAKIHGVTIVVTEGPAPASSFLEEVFSAGALRIYRLRAPAWVRRGLPP